MQQNTNKTISISNFELKRNFSLSLALLYISSFHFKVCRALSQSFGVIQYMRIIFGKYIALPAVAFNIIERRSVFPTLLITVYIILTFSRYYPLYTV